MIILKDDDNDDFGEDNDLFHGALVPIGTSI
jgi:hypothetical protein